MIGVEPASISTLATSIAAGLPVPRPAGVSIADALGPPSIGAGPLAVLRELLDEAVSVSEEQIAEAFRFLYARAKLAVEPAARRAGRRAARGARRALAGHRARALGRQRLGRRRRAALLAG